MNNFFTEGIYLNDLYEIDGQKYQLQDIKVEHIKSADNFVVGIYLVNVLNPQDHYWESVSRFLKDPFKKVFKTT